MQRAVLRVLWLAAILLVSNQPSARAESSWANLTQRCEDVVKTYGFVFRLHTQCGRNQADLKGEEADAQACRKSLGNIRYQARLEAGLKVFDSAEAKDPNEQQRSHAQFCNELIAFHYYLLPTEWSKKEDIVQELLDSGESKKALEQAVLLEKEAASLARGSLTHLLTKNILAVALMENGRFNDAVELNEQLLRESEITFGSQSATTATHLHNIGEALSRLDKPQESELILSRALNIYHKLFRGNSSLTAETTLSVAIAVMKQGKYGPAREKFDEAIDAFKHLDAPDLSGVASVKFNMALLQKYQGNYDDARALLAEALSAQVKTAPENGLIVRELMEIGDILLKQKHFSEAETYLLKALKICRASLGDENPLIVNIFDGLGQATYGISETMRGKLRSNPDISRDYMDTLREYVRFRQLASDSALLLRNYVSASYPDYHNFTVFYRYLTALYLAKLFDIAELTNTDRESFRLAQIIIWSSADAAIRQMALRFTRENDSLAALVRDQQEAIEARQALQQRLLIEVGNGSERKELKIRDKIDNLRVLIGEQNAKIDIAFPAYASMLRPKLLDIDEARKMLGSDEALVIYLSYAGGIHIWVVTKDTFSWHLVTDKSGTAQNADDTFIEKMVSRFRRGLEFDKLADGKDELFDLGFSYELYHRLFGEIEAEVKDKHHLLIVPSGALTALPFQLLVTEKPPIDKPTQDQLKAYRDAAWIVKRHAITILPSVRSLESLRSLASKPWGPKTMIGFGDPVFDPVAVADKRGESAHRGLTGNADYTEFWKGADLDRDKLRHALGRLPDTAKELRDVAASLNVPSSDIHLGADASETTVKQAKLSDYRIIYFATHGLVAGDVKGVGEPSLALSLPSQPSDFDDGLLTASEIAQLKLNADWVVLSACNTIAGEKPGAEALSGLARAFFYAGARSLLVSHWAGKSKATARIATKTFEIMTQKPGTGRAEALRLAMVDFLNDEKDQWNSYPAFWGAFSLIGGDRAPN